MDIYEIINRMRTERKQIEDFNLRVTYYARVSTTRDEQTMSIRTLSVFSQSDSVS